MNVPSNIKRNNVVLDAIRDTPSYYWEGTLSMRSRGDEQQSGSSYDMSPRCIEAAIKAADWFDYSHDDVSPGVKAFVTHDIGGDTGVIALDKFCRTEPHTYVSLVDPKNTGFYSAEVKRHPDQPHWKTDPSNFTVILIGDHEGKDVVFTFHPGEPAIPSTLNHRPAMQVTAVAALELGLQTLKLRH